MYIYGTHILNECVYWRTKKGKCTKYGYKMDAKEKVYSLYGWKVEVVGWLPKTLRWFCLVSQISFISFTSLIWIFMHPCMFIRWSYSEFLFSASQSVRVTLYCETNCASKKLWGQFKRMVHKLVNWITEVPFLTLYYVCG